MHGCTVQITHKLNSPACDTQTENANLHMYFAYAYTCMCMEIVAYAKDTRAFYILQE